MHPRYSRTCCPLGAQLSWHSVVKQYFTVWRWAVGLDFRAAHVVDKHQQAIDSFAVISEGQDNVLDAFESLVRSHIGRFGQERLACFDNMGAVLPDRAWRPLIFNLRKPRARVVFEKMFRNIGCQSGDT